MTELWLTHSNVGGRALHANLAVLQPSIAVEQA
jgi:hypothetical protein